MWIEPLFDADAGGSSPGVEKPKNNNNNKRRRGRRRGGGGNKGGQGQQPANATQGTKTPPAESKEVKGVTLRGTVKIEGAMPDLEPTTKPKPPRGGGDKSAPRKAPNKNRRNRERPRIVEDEEPENAFKIILRTAQLPQDQKLTLDEYFAKYEIEVPDLPDEGEQHDAMD